MKDVWSAAPAAIQSAGKPMAMKHIMKVQAGPFDKLKSGKKVIESRLYDEKRRRVNLGDTIEFQKEPDQQDVCEMKFSRSILLNRRKNVLFLEFD